MQFGNQCCSMQPQKALKLVASPGFHVVSCLRPLGRAAGTYLHEGEKGVQQVGCPEIDLRAEVEVVGEPAQPQHHTVSLLVAHKVTNTLLHEEEGEGEVKMNLWHLNQLASLKLSTLTK